MVTLGRLFVKMSINTRMTLTVLNHSGVSGTPFASCSGCLTSSNNFARSSLCHLSNRSANSLPVSPCWRTATR